MTTLIINICKEKMHYLEFVKPIEDILKQNGTKFITKHYTKITDRDLFNKKIEKIIICGTSLKDDDCLSSENLKKFKWIKMINKPILGICGGMQIISLIYNSELEKKTEIGMIQIEFKKDFLGIKSHKKIRAYELHNNSVDVDEKKFDIIAFSENCIQAIKHKSSEIYGVLFHPEVRNKNVILNFLNK